jgi:serine/threonine protein kinase
MEDILLGGIEALRSIEVLKENLPESQRSSRRLCERVAPFESPLRDLLQQCEENLIEGSEGLEQDVTILLNLLCELRSYLSEQVEECSRFRCARRVLVNASLRGRTAEDFAAFNQRIQSSLYIWCPDRESDLERQREEDFEDFKLQMELMSQDLMHALSEAQRTGSRELQTLIQELKEDCDGQQVELMERLSAIESKVSANQKVTFRDLGAVEELLSQETERVLTAMREELNDFQSALQETRMLLLQLQESVGESQREIVREIEERLATQTAVTALEMESLKQALGEDKREILHALENKMSALNLLEIEEEVQLMREDLMEIRERQDEICEGVKDLQMIVKLLSDKQLSLDEAKSRKILLEKLQLPETTSLTLGPVLGQGGFGQVRLGVFKQTTKVAVKLIRGHELGLQTRDIEAIENELIVMDHVRSHPNILVCYGFLRDRDRDREREMQILLEFAPYNSLSSWLYDTDTFPSPFSVRLVMGWLNDLASALEHIHSKRIKHRDIKAENCLVFEGLKLKLCDFGLAREHSPHLASSQSSAGTDGFKAPEVINRQGTFFASDVYSWAMTAYQMLLRAPPSALQSVTHIVSTAVHRVHHDTEEQGCPAMCELFEKLLLQCVKRHVRDRPTSLTLSQEMARIVQTMGGDPRLTLNVHDSEYVESLEALAKRRAKLSMAIAEERERQSGCTSADTESSVFQSSAPSSVSAKPALFPSQSLIQSEAIELLISLGCSTELHEHVARQREVEVIDGLYLSSIQESHSVEILQLLEGNQSKLRIPKLISVYEALQTIKREGGLPEDRMREIREKLAKREQEMFAKQEQLVRDRKQEREREKEKSKPNEPVAKEQPTLPSPSLAPTSLSRTTPVTPPVPPTFRRQVVQNSAVSATPTTSSTPTALVPTNTKPHPFLNRSTPVGSAPQPVGTTGHRTLFTKHHPPVAPNTAAQGSPSAVPVPSPLASSSNPHQAATKHFTTSSGSHTNLRQPPPTTVTPSPVVPPAPVIKSDSALKPMPSCPFPIPAVANQNPVPGQPNPSPLRTDMHRHYGSHHHGSHHGPHHGRGHGGHGGCRNKQGGWY